MGECPPTESLGRLLREELGDPELARVLAHVEGCAVCQETLHGLSRSDPGPTPPHLRSALLEVTANGSVAEADAFFRELKCEMGIGNEPRPDVEGYEILEEIGRGGVGVVYRARHLALNRLVALKMILAGPHLFPECRERFRREALAVARLQHPNIVQVHEVGEQAGCPYLALELVEGGNLAGWLAGVPRPAVDVARIVATLAGAVEYAHRQGVIHRDLKPANILLQKDEGRRMKAEKEQGRTTASSFILHPSSFVPKIADFGLAKLMPEAGIIEDRMTQTGVIMGTPVYVAPEQARGDAAASPPADVYSLGVILYEALTGRPPFQGATAMETLVQAAHQEPVPPSRLNATVPRDLETVCLKCLEKQPHRRYVTALALAEDLARFQRGEPVTARRVGWFGRLVRLVRRNPTATALAITAALLLGVAVGAGLREREIATERRAESARWSDRLDSVTRLQQDGRFAEARAILQEAQTDDPDLRQRIEEARARLELVERLDGIRLGRGWNVDGGVDYAGSSRRYAEVFHEAGLGEAGEDPEETARRLAPSPVRKAIVAALDDWAVCAEKSERDWILSVALRLDPGPWRDRVRDPAGWANTQGFPALAAEADIRNEPVNLMVAFGTRWRRLGGDPTTFLGKVQQQHPTDFWLNFELGYLLTQRDPPAAVGYYRAALAVRPDAAVANGNLGYIFARAGRIDDAIYHYRRGLDSAPSEVAILVCLGSALADRGDLDEGIGCWRKALALKPNQPGVQHAIRRAQLRLGRLEEMRGEWRQVLAGGPTDHVDWDGYAELCLFLGRENDYRRACRDLLDRFESSSDPQVAERTGRACLLAPTPPDEARRAAAVIDRAMAGDLQRLPAWVPPYFWFAKGLAEYRLGNFENAVAVMTKKTSGVLGPAPGLVTAMALYRLGRKEEARSALDAAVKSFDWQPTKANSREAWIYHVLRREAEKIILPGAE